MKLSRIQNNYFTSKKFIVLIIIHLGLGFLCVDFSFISKLWAIIAFILGVYFIVKNKNRYNEAAIWTGYYTGMEVLLRITKGTLSYEMGKYSIIIFLLLGLAYQKHRKIYLIWVIFIIVLLPSIFVMPINSNVFESVRFTLSGIISLAISVIYFAGLKTDWLNVKRIIAAILLPMLSLVIVLTLKTPDFSSITFTADSTELTTGGFGPVHVSTILGLGVLIMGVFIILQEVIFYNKWFDLILFGMLLFRGLLSFSRSGIFSGIIALIFSVLFILFSKSIKVNNTKILLYLAMAVFVGYISWNQVNKVTGGMAYNRFTGKYSDGTVKADMTTGRSDLFIQEINMFLDFPILGVGVSNAAKVREELYQNSLTSHTEYSRLLSEHGMLGMIAIFILLLFPVYWYVKVKGYSRLLLLMFSIYTLANMLTASTRTALPMFVFGLSFIQLKEFKK